MVANANNKLNRLMRGGNTDDESTAIRQPARSRWQELGRPTDEGVGERLKGARLVSIEILDPNPDQPRQNARDASIDELAADIRVRGVLQPLLVRPTADGRLQIVAGERRYWASQEAGLTEVPVTIRDMTDEEARITALVENIQREDLAADEEALIFQELAEEPNNLTHREIGALINKSHNYVGRRLRLLQNPDHLRDYREGKATLERMLGEREDVEVDEAPTEAPVTTTAPAAEIPGSTMTSDSPWDSGSGEGGRSKKAKLSPALRRMIELIESTQPATIDDEDSDDVLGLVDDLIASCTAFKEAFYDPDTGERVELH